MKKLRILALGLPRGFPGVFADTTFAAECFLEGGILDWEFGRGVSGFVEFRLAIVGGGGEIRVPLGGVGGLPVEGFEGVLIDGGAFSRGFRNII